MSDSRDPKVDEATRVGRREALKTLGKYAVYTAPVLLSVMQPRQAKATISGPPPM